MVSAELITIGNELLIGKTINTNAAYLGERLTRLGIHVSRNLTIPDTAEAIVAALDAAVAGPAALILLTGGLGATKDDITKKVLAQYFQMGMAVHQPTLERITAYFEMRGRTLNALTATHAEVPDGCQVLDNAVGAAPGMVFRPAEGRLLASFPGVPYELKYLFENGLEPLIRAELPAGHIRHRTFCTVGVPESNLAKRLRAFEDSLPDAITLAYNPTVQVLRLRLTLLCPPAQAPALDTAFDVACTELLAQLGPDCYGEEDDTLEGVLGRLLVARGQTIATAESCTGGALSARLCSVSGASAYVLGNVVTYSNEMKTKLLGVHPETLAEHGAVSEQVAIQMAEGARQLSGTDIALSTTGVAGPTGGSPQKPVGTVWIGYADAHSSFAKPYRFETDRHRNIERSVVSALDLARRHMAGLLILLFITLLSGCTTTKTGWPSAGRKAFMKQCVTHTATGDNESLGVEITKTIADEYCTCMLGKIMAIYPSMDDAEKKLLGSVMGEVQMEKLAEDCIMELGIFQQ